MPVYTISIASRLTSLPIHTIRWLEKQGIVEASRSAGRQRLFSNPDIELLQEVAALLQRKVNLAGIRIILQMKQTHHIEKLRIPDEERDIQVFGG